MVGLSSTSLSEDEKKFLKYVQPKGVVYFRRNVDSPNQLVELARQVHDVLDHPIIAIDQEGGPVARLSSPFTRFPSNAALASDYEKTGKLEPLIKKATWMAKELKAIGVNCNFTPVVDVLTNSKNPVMQNRTFGSDPLQVSKLAQATIQQFNMDQVLSCAKHFPGHGDTLVDSHFDLPSVDTLKSTLFKRELLPFKGAIKSRVPMIMTAHVVFNKIDKGKPASLSHYFLKKVLRDQLGYKGCIVSDDLEMKAIAKHYDTADACLKSIQAGCNIALVCKNMSLGYACFERLSRSMHTQKLQTRAKENTKLFRQWHKTYLQPRSLRKRKQWGWTAHKVEKLHVG